MISPTHWQAYYIQHKGIRCPVCHSPTVTGGFVAVDEAAAVQGVDCDECGSNWEDHYTLKEVKNLCVGIPQWLPDDVVVWTDPQNPDTPQLATVIEANDSALPNPSVRAKLQDGREISGEPAEFKLWERHV